MRRTIPPPSGPPAAPQPTEWGPAVWRLLHSLAERSLLTPQKQLGEEKRLWFNLLNGLRYSLPCPNCRKHYNEYYITHLIDNFIKNNTFNMELRIWLYNLHCDANKHTGKYTTIMIEELRSLYGNYTGFRDDAKTFVEHMQRGVFYKWINHEDMMKTRRTLYELISFYSV